MQENSKSMLTKLMDFLLQSEKFTTFVGILNLRGIKVSLGLVKHDGTELHEFHGIKFEKEFSITELKKMISEIKARRKKTA